MPDLGPRSFRIILLLKSILHLIVAALIVAASGGSLFAQSPSAAVLIEELTRAESEVEAVDRALDRQADPERQTGLREQATALHQSALGLAEQLEAQLKRLDDRLAGLGPVQEGVEESPEIATERDNLNQQRASIDAAVKRARLAAVEAQQFAEEIDRSRAQQISERITTRAASPLTPRFWKELGEAFPRDLRRVETFASQGAEQIRDRWRGNFAWPAIVGGLASLLILFPLRRFARRVGQRFLIEGAPGARIRRSANALWRIFIGTASTVLAAFVFVQGLRWAGLLADRWTGVAEAFIGATAFCGFVIALGSALLMRDQPSWRVAPFHDDTAQRLTPLSWMLAGIALFNIVLRAFNTAVVASQPALVATQALEAILQLGVIVAGLLILGSLRSARAEEEDQAVGPMGPVQSVVSLGVWLLSGAAAFALAVGYVSLSLIITQSIAWAVVLFSTIYLLMIFVDDLATSIFTRGSRFGRAMSRGLGVRGSMIDQFGLLLSVAVRILLALIAVVMLVMPFGGEGGFFALFSQVGDLARGVQIGGVSISPGTILRGAVVLLTGLMLARLFSNWLENRYLPATDLDGSGRNSVGLVARYVGIALAVIWALAALNIGIERIALLLSALSVGIGFGLQAITQNFISGLILLAERPIKIGDLIRVGTDEGDVKRISVRSTEIVLADHSTLIVPNSELITKSVLNKTLAGPLGRIQIQFSVPIETDAVAVREIVLQAFSSEPAVLEEPAPSVFIDAITDSRIMFNCFGHVSSPRNAYGPRSNILMKLLAQFRETRIDIGTVPQKLEVVSEDHDSAVMLMQEKKSASKRKDPTTY